MMIRFTVVLSAIALCSAQRRPIPSDSIVLNEIKVWSSNDDTPQFIELIRTSPSVEWIDYQIVLFDASSQEVYTIIQLDSEEFIHSQYYIIYLDSEQMLCAGCSGAVGIYRARLPDQSDNGGEIQIRRGDVWNTFRNGMVDDRKAFRSGLVDDRKAFQNGLVDDRKAFRNGLVDGLVYQFSETDDVADELTTLLGVDSFIINTKRMSLARCGEEFVQNNPTINEKNVCGFDKNMKADDTYELDDEEDENFEANSSDNNSNNVKAGQKSTRQMTNIPVSVTKESKTTGIKHTSRFTSGITKPRTTNNIASVTSVKKKSTKYITVPINSVKTKPSAKHTTASVTSVKTKPSAKHTTASVTSVKTKPSAKHTTASVTSVKTKPSAKHTTASVTSVKTKPTAKHTTASVTSVKTKPTTKHTSAPVTSVKTKPTTKHTTASVTSVKTKPTTKHTTASVTSIKTKPTTKHTTASVTSVKTKPTTKHTTVSVTSVKTKPTTTHTTASVTSIKTKPTTKHTTAPVTSVKTKPTTKHTAASVTSIKTKHTTASVTSIKTKPTTKHTTASGTSIKTKPTTKHTTKHTTASVTSVKTKPTTKHTPRSSVSSSHTFTSVSSRSGSSVSSQKTSSPPSSVSQSAGSTTVITPTPSALLTVINEANLVVERDVKKYYVELKGPPKANLRCLSVVVFDGLTDSTLLHLSLDANHTLDANGLLVIGIKLNVAPEAVAVTLYNHDEWTHPYNDHVSVDARGLLDVIIVGKDRRGIKNDLKEIMIPNYPSRVIVVNTRKLKSSESFTLSRCKEKHGLPDPGHFLLTKTTRGLPNNCSMGFATRVEFKLKDALCHDFSRADLQTKLIDVLVQKVADVCMCGVTRLSFKQRKFMCGSLILQTNIQSSLTVPSLSGAIFRSFKTFVERSKTLVVNGRNYHTDKCYLNCQSAVVPHGKPHNSYDQVNITVAVVVSCIAAFLIVVVLLVLYMRRRRRAIEQFKLHRLDESEAGILHEDQDDIEQEPTFKNITLG